MQQQLQTVCDMMQQQQQQQQQQMEALLQDMQTTRPRTRFRFSFRISPLWALISWKQTLTSESESAHALDASDDGVYVGESRRAARTSTTPSVAPLDKKQQHVELAVAAKAESEGGGQRESKEMPVFPSGTVAGTVRGHGVTHGASRVAEESGEESGGFQNATGALPAFATFRDRQGLLVFAPSRPSTNMSISERPPNFSALSFEVNESGVEVEEATQVEVATNSDWRSWCKARRKARACPTETWSSSSSSSSSPGDTSASAAAESAYLTPSTLSSVALLGDAGSRVSTVMASCQCTVASAEAVPTAPDSTMAAPDLFGRRKPRSRQKLPMWGRLASQ
jgi:hypothetical protein